MTQFFSKRHEDYPDPVKSEEIQFNGQVQSVSFSTLSTYEQCPYAVYLSKVKSIPSVSGPAADRGSDLHNLLENYVLGNVAEVNWKRFKSGDYHEPLVEHFRRTHRTKPKACIPEFQMAFTKDLKKTKWGAKNTWLRAMIDIVIHSSKSDVRLYDYKTGSNQSAAKHRSQLMLYALLYMLWNEKVENVEVAAVYLDLKLDNFYTSYTRNDLELYWPRYLARLQQVTEQQSYQPNPNGFTCKWCQHKKANENIGQVEPACEFAYIG